MTYTIRLEGRLEKKIEKLQIKDRKTNERLIDKMIELNQNPYAGKPLRRVMKGKWRIHIGSYVLIYTIDETARTVTFLDFAHHDDAYKK